MVDKGLQQRVELFLNKKTSSREIEIKCKGIIVNANDIIPYVNHEKIEACKRGCPNYEKKWSCPPYSRDYLSVKKDYLYAYLLVLSSHMNQYLDIKNKYLAIKAANVTLKTIIEKMARILEEELEGYALLSGSCRLCKPCNCKIGKPCKKPNKMRYSMEATHLDVSLLTKEKMNHSLLWYEKKRLPKYTSTVSLVLTNKMLDNATFKTLLENIIIDIK